MIVGLPYDAEVEYLESTWTQWIDTGVNASTSLVINCDFQFTNATGNQLNGTYGDSGRLQFGIVNGEWSVGIGTVGVSGATADVLRHSITINVPQKQVLFDRINYGDYSSASATYESYQHIWLFARTNTESKAPCRERIFSCAITSNNILVRSFVPVRVGSGANAVGYMYDRVTHKLFGNQGTGAFVIGPDVAEPVMGLHFYPDGEESEP